MKIFQYLCDTIEKRGSTFCVLIDPDKAIPEKLHNFAEKSRDLGVDALLVGSSLLINNSIDKTVLNIKSRTKIPVILFPGSAQHISMHVDAILFLSLISGRNPNLLFGDHVIAAPSIKAYNIEPISTGYMLIESGSISSTEFISNTLPIPRNKPEIALAHALAAEYMGMKFIYLEAGSGAEKRILHRNEGAGAVERQTSSHGRIGRIASVVVVVGGLLDRQVYALPKPVRAAIHRGGQTGHEHGRYCQAAKSLSLEHQQANQGEKD